MKPKKFELQCVGYSVVADWYESNNDKVLFNLIGFGSNIQKYNEFLSSLVKNANTSVLTIDYSGHGESPFDINDLTPAQNFLEVITAFDWLKDQYPDAEISVMGASYGGFLATQLTKYRTFDKLILRVPAIYKPENFYTTWKKYSIEEGLKYRETAEKLVGHPLLKRASKFKGRSLVVTHELDDVCPKNSTMAFVSAFNADHIEAKGFKHSFGESDVTVIQINEYYKTIAEWLVK
jgi:dipeptidyl aminopeptidase/acylaminoacyl peptidase